MGKPSSSGFGTFGTFGVSSSAPVSGFGATGGFGRTLSGPHGYGSFRNVFCEARGSVIPPRFLARPLLFPSFRQVTVEINPVS